jgi:class 3 adenylate cyclase
VDDDPDVSDRKGPSTSNPADGSIGTTVRVIMMAFTLSVLLTIPLAYMVNRGLQYASIRFDVMGREQVVQYSAGAFAALLAINFLAFLYRSRRKIARELVGENGRGQAKNKGATKDDKKEKKKNKQAETFNRDSTSGDGDADPPDKEEPHEFNTETAGADETAAAEEADKDEDSPNDKADQQATTITPEVKQKTEDLFLKFVNASLEEAAGQIKQIDRMAKFGLLLYFSGAGEVIGQASRLPAADIATMLQLHMRKLGYSAEKTARFINNLNEYMLDERSAAMFKMGRQSMAQWVARKKGTETIKSALEEWQKPKGQTAGARERFVAILFTDIVGSTALTVKLGNEGAQAVVRTHNNFVRAALQQYAGTEIKHTGDGIMATFGSSISAARASIMIQNEVKREVAADASFPLRICIGLNAGEPIHEDNDIFGTPVQLAARILAKAQGDQIYCSEIVLQQCQGLTFSSAGKFSMKGFDQPIEVFELVSR